MSTSAIKIKGGRAGLWVILDKDVSFPQVEAELQEKLNKNMNFFPEGSSITVVAKGFGEKSRHRILELFGQRRITVEFADAEPATIIAQKTAEEQLKRRQHEQAVNVQQPSKGLAPEPQPAQSQKAQINQQIREEKMLVINRTVRGGEEIISEGSILICGNVHPGANIIAGGNIDIRGNCRGIVHAGAYGDTNAIIIADTMQPMQIRIANLIARSPDEMEDPDRAEKASIKNGRIVVEPVVR